jgi:hypothetical protein
MGRRMAEGAALLVDHVLPAVGYRQWVLSFPGPMAVRLGYDAPLLTRSYQPRCLQIALKTARSSSRPMTSKSWAPSSRITK